MNKKLTEGVARALAAAYYRGDDRHQYDCGPKEFERDVKRYVEENWERWLSAAQAVLTMSDEPIKPQPVKPFPRYVKLGMTALRNTGGCVYYRDAGQWSVKAKWKDGKLVVVGKEQEHLAHLSGAELVPCDKKAWKEDNKGYTTIAMSPRKRADEEADDSITY
jgi:hypothetical protein